MNWQEILSGKDAVIFDLDGTVIDSMWVWKQIDIDYFSMFNIPFPDDYQKRIEGMSVYETAVYSKENYDFPQSVEEMINTWTDMAFDKYSNEVTVKNGVLDFLKYLKRANKKLGIATSNSEILCKEVLRSKGLLDYFDAILTGDQCGAGKPAPDVFINTAKALNVDCSKCLVFEDLCQGITAGNRAGMETVTIWDEYSGKDWDEKKLLADHYILDYREILDEIC